MDWSKIPDIVAIASLAFAFASILKQNNAAAHRLWLVGWTMIAIHFMGSMVANEPGLIGLIGNVLSLNSLAAAGICFMWATVPQETGVRNRRLGTVAFLSTSIYLTLAALPHVAGWAFDFASVLISVGPLSVAIFYRRSAQHPLRWLTVVLQFALGAELLVLRRQTGDPGLGIDAILFAVYMGCCIYFWYSHQNGTTGSIITIGGFLAWASVFAVAPALQHFLPHFRMESEVWNLPKYVVAIGMLLLLLEKQIERSQYLALHDDLTSLANRRLFQDRLSSAMERARRSGTSMALLQMDLNRFKEVNDTYGHHVGDLLLQHVSAVLNMRARRTDTVARTGGDEFSLILEEPARREDAETVASTLRKILSEPIVLQGNRILTGASIGIAIYPEDAEDASALSIIADMKMYEAKQSNRGSFRSSRELVESSRS